MEKSTSIRPAGHVLVPAAAIGALSMLLAAGMHLTHTLDRLDDLITRSVSKGSSSGLVPLPAWMPWLAALLCAFILPLAIFNIPGTWRRSVIWITTVVLVAGWAPVLHLAARPPEISPALITAIWAGVCAMVYCGNHRMPSDEDPSHSASSRPSP